MPGKFRLQYWCFSLLFMLLAMSFAPSSRADPVVAGQIEFVEGDVSIMNAEGKNRIPHVNEPLWEGDTISTGPDGELHARMADEAYIGLRANTTLKVDTYVAEATDLDKVVLSLIRGTFRSITGWVGRNNPQNYHINAGPTVAIGVRGTDHEPAFIPDPLPGEIALGDPGAYDKVNSGRTFIQHPGGIIELGPQQSGFAPRDPKLAPRMLDKPPKFYRPTKNESRIERRKKELSTRIGKKRNERQQQTRKLEKQHGQAGHLRPTREGQIRQRQVHKSTAERHPRLHRGIQHEKRPEQQQPKLSD
jgi:hypothetical protein